MASSDLAEELFSSDYFRMFVFKVKQCPREKPHDWTGCQFAHPTEKARRRDPTRHTYNFNACTEFRKHGSCRSGDGCLFAHGVFEGWLHPARYHTQLCKFGAACQRKICFFAHSEEQLRAATEGSQEQALSQREELLAELRQQPGMVEELCKLELQAEPRGMHINNRVVDPTLAAWMESRRVANLFSNYRARMGMNLPAGPQARFPLQQPAWDHMQGGGHGPPGWQGENSLADELQASLGMQARPAFRPQQHHYQSVPQEADARGLAAQGGHAAQDVAQGNGPYSPLHFMQRGTLRNAGTVDSFQGRFGDGEMYARWPPRPSPNFHSPSDDLQHATTSPLRYIPQDFLGVAQSPQSPSDPSSPPIQAEYPAAGYGQGNLSGLLKRLTGNEGWPNRF